jgi:hypothetical protein
MDGRAQHRDPRREAVSAKVAKSIVDGVNRIVGNITGQT